MFWDKFLLVQVAVGEIFDAPMVHEPQRIIFEIKTGDSLRLRGFAVFCLRYFGGVRGPAVPFLLHLLCRACCAHCSSCACVHDSGRSSIERGRPIQALARAAFRRDHREEGSSVWQRQALGTDTTCYSSVGRASDCRSLQQSDGPWFDSGWPDL